MIFHVVFPHLTDKVYNCQIFTAGSKMLNMLAFIQIGVWNRVGVNIVFK